MKKSISKQHSLHYIIVGPRLRSDNSNTGGVTISLMALVEYMQEQGFTYHWIDTQYFRNRWLKVLNAPRVFMLFLWHIVSAQVVFVNVSQFGAKTIAPLLFVFTKVFGKKFVFRPFGGAMQDYYEKYSGWQKHLFDRTLLQSDIFFLQTKALIEFFKQSDRDNIRQLPTSRAVISSDLMRPGRPYQRRFIFLGHIKASKGIGEILNAIEQLDKSYQIDIYGAIEEEHFLQNATLASHYRGVLAREKVIPTLRQYDVLILPTYYRGEGYPGAIIEAYSVGLPIITTDWRAISEIVEAGKTGLLISPKSSDELIEAIQFFNQNNYPAFAQHAQQYFMNQHAAETVNRRVFSAINGLFH